VEPLGLMVSATEAEEARVECGKATGSSPVMFTEAGTAGGHFQRRGITNLFVVYPVYISCTRFSIRAMTRFVLVLPQVFILMLNLHNRKEGRGMARPGTSQRKRGGSGMC
jgi:hypothetical protein